MKIIRVVNNEGKEHFLNASLIENFNVSGGFVNLKFNGVAMTIKEPTAPELCALLSDQKEVVILDKRSVLEKIISWVKGLLSRVST